MTYFDKFCGIVFDSFVQWLLLWKPFPTVFVFVYFLICLFMYVSKHFYPHLDDTGRIEYGTCDWYLDYPWVWYLWLMSLIKLFVFCTFRGLCFVVKGVKVCNSQMTYNPITITAYVWTVIHKSFPQLNYHSLATQLSLTYS